LLEQACRPALFSDGAIIPALIEAGVAEDGAGD